jgi:PAS domain S-box-containing protein
MKQNISTEVLSMAITHSIERKKLELKYRRLVESTNACIYEIDFKENKFLYCNDVCCDLTGYTKNEIMKLPPEAILTPNSVKKWYKRFERMAKGESIDSSETYQIVKKDGTTGYALINADYRKDDYGNILGARVIAIDVTERVLREKQLRTIFKTAPVGIGMTTIDRNFIEVNERFCNMVEMNREDLIGINARIIYPSDEEYKRVGEIKYDKIRIGEVGTLETQIKTKSGKLIDVLLSSSYTNPENPNEGVIFTMLDLTSVKEAEKEVSKVLEEKINAWRSEISDIRGVEQLDKILSMRI